MAFRLRITAFAYDRFGDTCLTGILESGQIGGHDAICIPTTGGGVFQSVITSMEGPGPTPPPYRAEAIGNAILHVGVRGAPRGKDVAVPSVAVDRVASDAPVPGHYLLATDPFTLGGVQQIVTVDDHLQTLSRRECGTLSIIERIVCEYTRAGCAIEELIASPSGSWLVSQRCSGQGEWGYDVFRTNPLAREGGISEDAGYMIDAPSFSPDERRIVGGYGSHWLGGWWAHPEDEYEDPSRGGLLKFGHLFIHHLPSHRVDLHEFQVDLPEGWQPTDPWSDIWYGARHITPGTDSIRMTLYGSVGFEIPANPPPVILLPSPAPDGGRL